MAGRRTGWIKTMLAVTCLYGAALFVGGLLSLREEFFSGLGQRTSFGEWLSIIAALAYLPASLLGVPWPRIGTRVFIAISILGLLALAITTGEHNILRSEVLPKMLAILVLPSVAAARLYRTLGRQSLHI